MLALVLRTTSHRTVPAVQACSPCQLRLASPSFSAVWLWARHSTFLSFNLLSGDGGEIRMGMLCQVLRTHGQRLKDPTPVPRPSLPCSRQPGWERSTSPARDLHPGGVGGCARAFVS